MPSKLKRKAQSAGPAIAAVTEKDVEFVCDEIERKIKRQDYRMARCHLMLGRSLWRGNFKVKFQAYRLARAEADWKAAADAFMLMYTENPNEPQFYRELSQVLENITKEAGDADCKSLFSRLPAESQCEILLKFCQSVGSTLEQATLLIYAIQQYPSIAAQQGASLIETLLSAEKDTYPKNPLNAFRKCLVADVLPVLLGSPGAQIGAKMLQKLLTRGVEFYALLGCKQEQQQRPQAALIAGLGEHSAWRVQSAFAAGRQLADRVCSQLGVDVNLAKASLDSAVSSLRHSLGSQHLDRKANKCLACVCFLLLSEAACRYQRLARPGERADSQQTLLLHCLGAAPDDKLVSSAHKEAGKAFLTACACVRLGRDSSGELSKEFNRLLDSIRSRSSLAWLDSLCAEYHLYSGNSQQCAKCLRQCRGALAPEHIVYYEAQCHLVERRLTTAVPHLVECCLSFSDDSLFRDSQPPQLPPAPCLVPLSSSLVLHATVLTLCSVLTGLAKRLGRESPSELLGHCLTLSQYDWPANEESAYGVVLPIVREKRELQYCPQFAQFVVSAEIVEELAALHAEDVRLRLFADSGGAQDQATFTKLLIGQIERCHDNVKTLMYEFVKSERKSLLQLAEQAADCDS